MSYFTYSFILKGIQKIYWASLSCDSYRNAYPIWLPMYTLLTCVSPAGDGDNLLMIFKRMTSLTFINLTEEVICADKSTKSFLYNTWTEQGPTQYPVEHQMLPRQDHFQFILCQLLLIVVYLRGSVSPNPRGWL